jgi:hypothetical protein
MKHTTKAQRQAAYLTEFSAAVVAAAPQYAGRIDWDTALHFYFTRVPAADAAAQYIANRGNA